MSFAIEYLPLETGRSVAFSLLVLWNYHALRYEEVMAITWNEVDYLDGSFGAKEG